MHHCIPESLAVRGWQLSRPGRMVIPVGPEGYGQEFMQVDKLADGKIVTRWGEGAPFGLLCTCARVCARLVTLRRKLLDVMYVPLVRT